ncbi:hypothetical protein BH20ACT9_BH20ACT9_08140 [soil metagenome]
MNTAATSIVAHRAPSRSTGLCQDRRGRRGATSARPRGPHRLWPRFPPSGSTVHRRGVHLYPRHSPGATRQRQGVGQRSRALRQASAASPPEAARRRSQCQAHTARDARRASGLHLSSRPPPAAGRSIIQGPRDAGRGGRARVRRPPRDDRGRGRARVAVRASRVQLSDDRSRSRCRRVSRGFRTAPGRLGKCGLATAQPGQTAGALPLDEGPQCLANESGFLARPGESLCLRKQVVIESKGGPHRRSLPSASSRVASHDAVSRANKPQPRPQPRS